MKEEDRQRQKLHSTALYNVIIGDFDVERFARVVGKSARSVYRWAENEAAMPVWVPRALFELDMISEAQFAALVGAHEAGLVVAKKATPNQLPDYLRAMADLGIAAGRVSSEVVAAIEDGHVDAMERARIERELRKVEEVTAGIRALLEKTEAA